jgi:hypothetical protein
MTIEIKHDAKTSEEAFGIAEYRVKELFDLVDGTLCRTTNPTEDMLFLQSKCSEREFGYVLLMLGFTTGFRVAEYYYPKSGIKEILRKILSKLDSIR